MTRMLSLKAAFAASVCLLPLQAFAQSDTAGAPAPTTAAPPPTAAAPPPTTAAPGPLNNWVTLGAQYDSGRSYYLGRYSGAVNPGFYGLGDFHLGQRDAWDSGGTNYWEMEGYNLGLPDRSFNAKVGQQGTWGLSFYYQGIPYYATNSFKSVFQGNGSLVPGVAPGSLGVTYSRLLPANGIVNSLWIPRATNSPSALLFNYNLSTQRDIFGGTGKFQWGDWTISGAWRHEHKTGWQANSLAIGGVPNVTTAGTGNTAPTTFTSALAYFAQPIDYDTDRYDATAAYGDERTQVQLGYTYSAFTDNTGVFNAQNPFAFVPTSTFGGSVAGLRSIYVLPPSNSAHQVRMLFGYNFTPTTRFTANFEYGLAMQNAGFQTGIGNTNPGVLQPNLPRASFDGLMRTLNGSAALTAAPLPNLDLRLAYTINDNNNQSPRNLFNVNPTGASAASSYFLYSNLPYSYEHQSVVAEAGYRLGPQTKIILNDTVDSTYRTFANTSLVTSNRISAKIRGPVTDWAFGSLSAAHEDRVAHNYNTTTQWSLLCNTCNADPTNFLLFYEASRKHDEVKATLDVSPTNDLTASLIVKFSNDKYPDNSTGLRNNHNIIVGPDVSWQIGKSLTAHAFYTYQQIFYSQSSIYQSPNPPATPAPTATNTQFSVPWTANTTDSVQTFGVNVDWQAIPDVLKLSLDYNFSYGNTSYALGEGVVAFGGAITTPTFAPSITTQALPDVKSMLSVISLHGEYAIRPNITLMFGYAWERFTYKDFMVGTSPTQFANAFLPGTLAPNDSIHVVSAAMRFRF
jgi:MtrB/PioB family decaheme-associated outer membrane protein